MDKGKITQIPFIILICAIIVLYSTITQAQHIVIVAHGKPTSIRGLSVVNDELAWLSGSNGYVAKTLDGGKTWQWQQIEGFERADFRGVVAFSANEAIVMSSGTPALILKTSDGGKSWQQKYRNDDKAFFFDAIDFSDRRDGWVLGDPINNKFLLMRTRDGGETWQIEDDPLPPAQANEAAFAASNSCLRVVRKQLFIVTGGPAADLIHTNNEGKSWQIKPLPLVHGTSSQGAFSIAVNDKKIIVVGGDYRQDKINQQNACFSDDKGKSWILPVKSPEGYQSAAEHIRAEIYLTTGTPGSNITTDGGKNWIEIDRNSFNVCRKAKHGKLVLLAGNDGKVGVLEF